MIWIETLIGLNLNEIKVTFEVRHLLIEWRDVIQFVCHFFFFDKIYESNFLIFDDSTNWAATKSVGHLIALKTINLTRLENFILFFCSFFLLSFASFLFFHFPFVAIRYDLWNELTTVFNLKFNWIIENTSLCWSCLRWKQKKIKVKMISKVLKQ